MELKKKGKLKEGRIDWRESKFKRKPYRRRIMA